MTEHLKPDLASDIHPGLIALYEKLRAEPGWLDGFECTEEIYRAAKTWPDDNPAKALIGFGCSFGGLWFRGFARTNPTRKYQQDYSGLAVAGLKRKIANYAGAFSVGSFFTVSPAPGFLIYADPPYRGATAYAAAGDFDSVAFYHRCEKWADAGSVVFVSEYSAPASWVCVWERSIRTNLGLHSGRARIERLYRLGPK